MRLVQRVTTYLKKQRQGKVDASIYSVPLVSLNLSDIDSNSKQVYGPKSIQYDRDQAIVVCLVKDGEKYIESFIDYYLRVGFRHIVFLDNDSRDNTVEIASKYDHVTVLHSKLPFKYHQYSLRQYLIQRYAKDRWSLCVDIDEFFDWPFSNKLSLKSLIEYLNENRYTAVVGQMLDMFTDEVLLSTQFFNTKNWRKKFRYYDVSNIRKLPYANDHYKKNVNEATNSKSNPDIKSHFGGIRDSIFNIPDLYVTKHPLVFLDDKIKPQMRVHLIENSSIADFSCVLYHYKFLDNFLDKVHQAVNDQNYRASSYEYKRYLSALSSNPALNLKGKTAKELQTTAQLLEDGLIVVSEKYLSFVNNICND